MTILKTIFLIAGCLLLKNAMAQINSPTFQCVRSDTLFWSPAVNSCGAFISTDIYYSNAVTGPYSVIATITDENTTEFHHAVSGSAYYFLASNNDCPGLQSLYSDTLNNLPPATTSMERVTVEKDGVLLSWYDNNDSKTVGYIIYRSTSLGTLPIDTVYGVLEYVDRTASAEMRSETYYVLAIDQCGNTGLFDRPHNSIHLETELDFCRQHIKLTWNPYGIWQNGNESVQIWLGLDGASPSFEHQVQLTDTLAYITGITDNREYCISIVYKESGRNVTSSSNTVCLTSDVITPMNGLFIRNITVQPNGSVSILWDHTAKADLSQLSLNRGLNSMTLEPYQDLIGSRPAVNQSTYIDSDANAAMQPYFYRFDATDDCDTSSHSNIMSSIHLQASSKTASQNSVVWTALFAPGRNILEQRLCRIDENGVETELLKSTPDVLKYDDNITSPISGTQCYILKVTHVNKGGTDTLVATSNIACLQQQIGVFVPNAFVPEGANPVFKPEFAVDLGSARYDMQIFNRWGGKVYESSNSGGWDGRQEGRLLIPGVYFYVISLQQPDGTIQKLSGTVHLIR